MAGRGRYRCLLLGAIVVSAVAPAPVSARADAPEPSIAFINPVDAGPATVLSDKRTVNSSTYPLLAWTEGTTGTGFYVAFVFESATYRHSVSPMRPTDTLWQELWQVPDDMPDGPYTLSARLYGYGGDLLDEDRIEVTVTGANNGGAEAANTVFMNAPVPAGNGFYDPPGFRMGTRTTYYASHGTQQVRAFYSKTPRGEDPRWIECGDGAVAPEDDNPYATVRCTLVDGDRPSDVTLIGGIANDTPPGADPDPLRDGSSDSMIADPYVSRAGWIRLTWLSNRSQPGDCYPIYVDARDQRGAGLWHAPVDLHLRGGTGEVSFGATPATDLVQAPRSGAHRVSEQVHACMGDPADQTQARHDGSDVTHTEFVGGAGVKSSLGASETAVFTTAGETTKLAAWVDVDADDYPDEGEPADVIIWRQDTTIALTASRRVARRGETIKFRGSLDGLGSYCNDYRAVELQARRSREQPWAKVADTSTDMFGHFLVRYRVRRSTYFRAVSDYGTDFCEDAASSSVRVRVR